jgi:hypothetical protein
MSNTTKTDNGHLKHKLELRRYFLQKYHSATPPRVFDCCQGNKVIWSQLQSEFATATYWGVDLKPKSGRLKIDSARVLRQPGWDFDLIDCDTYGAPWKHYRAICENLRHPASVLLTIGTTLFSGSVNNSALDALGLHTLCSQLPTSFRRLLSPISTRYALTAVHNPSTLRLVEVVEAITDGTARYIGVRLEPVSNAMAAGNQTRRSPDHIRGT